MRSKIIFLGLVSLCFHAGPVTSKAATLAVDWGGNYVSGDQPFSSSGGFTGGEPDLISPSSGYAGTSSNFYGQVEIFSGTPALQTSVINATGGDRIQLKAGDTAGGQNAGFLILWKQADFLNGLDTGTVGLDSSSSVSLNIFTYANQTADSGRLVLRLGSDYYVSNRIYTGTGITTTADPTSLTYYAYDPVTTTINVNNPTSSTNLVSGGVISGITEVGFYFESSASMNAVRLTDVEINLVAVPEPATWLLLGLGLGGLCFLRKRTLLKS